MIILSQFNRSTPWFQSFHFIISIDFNLIHQILKSVNQSITWLSLVFLSELCVLHTNLSSENSGFLAGDAITAKNVGDTIVIYRVHEHNMVWPVFWFTQICVFLKIWMWRGKLGSSYAIQLNIKWCLQIHLFTWCDLEIRIIKSKQ